MSNKRIIKDLRKQLIAQSTLLSKKRASDLTLKKNIDLLKKKIFTLKKKNKRARKKEEKAYKKGVENGSKLNKKTIYNDEQNVQKVLVQTQGQSRANLENTEYNKQSIPSPIAKSQGINETKLQRLIKDLNIKEKDFKEQSYLYNLFFILEKSKHKKIKSIGLNYCIKYLDMIGLYIDVNIECLKLYGGFIVDELINSNALIKSTNEIIDSTSIDRKNNDIIDLNKKIQNYFDSVPDKKSKYKLIFDNNTTLIDNYIVSFKSRLKSGPFNDLIIPLIHQKILEENNITFTLNNGEGIRKKAAES